MTTGTITRWNSYVITCGSRGCTRSHTLMHIDATRRQAERHFHAEGWRKVGSRWVCAACWRKRKEEIS